MQHFSEILRSAVVRVAACHANGWRSIPCWEVVFFLFIYWISNFNLLFYYFEICALTYLSIRTIYTLGSTDITLDGYNNLNNNFDILICILFVMRT